ncbi:MAG: protein kinase [Chloroflexota bacterium]
MTLERGNLLHKRYRIVEILGQGGMGSVYRAVDENLGVDVAVKENLFTTDEYARQFRLEAVILANLRHPNLPRVTDHFVIADQGQYLVMDYIEGEDLRQRMERLGVLPEEDVIVIGAAMCDALSYLHTRKPPILHRDLKPGNVKITPEGHIYLVDFGLAKVVQGSQVTTTGARAMTPGYSPPEQYGTARTDPRSDIYSLGATLYAAISGVIPEDALARAMDNTQLTPLRKRNSKVSRRLSAAIEKAMGVLPEDRYQNGEAFKQALLAASNKNLIPDGITGSFSVEPPPEPAEPEEEFVERVEEAPEPLMPPRAVEMPSQARSLPNSKKRRRRLGCLPAGLILVLLGVLGALAFSFFAPGAFNELMALAGVSFVAPPPTATRTPTPLPVAQASLTPTEAEFTATPTNPPLPTETPLPTATPSPTLTPTPTITPMGGGYGQFAFASARTGVTAIYLNSVDGSSPPELIVSMPEGACQPAWSPDGERLVFVSPCTLAQDPYAIYPNSTLYTVNVEGTNVEQLLPEAGGDFEPAWSPDGERIAFTSIRSGHEEIYIYNLKDNSLTRLTETRPGEGARYPAWSPLGNQLVYSMKRFGTYQVWVMTDLGTAQQQIVRSGVAYHNIMPAWTRDSEVVVFSQRKVEGVSRPWLMAIPYADREEGLAGTYWERDMPITDIEFSPDGLWIILEGQEDGNYDIFLMPAGGGDRIRLTRDPMIDMDPAWRPIP